MYSRSKKIHTGGCPHTPISYILSMYPLSKPQRLSEDFHMHIVTAPAREPAVRAQKVFTPPKELGAVWEALVEDAHVSVMVLDASGVIEFANQVAVDWHGFGSVAECSGKQCSDFLPPDLVEERLGQARDRMASGGVFSIVGMCNGKMLQSTFRAISGPSGVRTLVVTRLAAPLDPLNPVPGVGVVAARVSDDGPLGVLTTREMEILKLIGLGLSSADIARRLGRSVKTVEWHRVSLGDKLNVTNRVELARIAIAAGLVGVSDVRKPVVAGVATEGPVTVA